MRNKKVDTNLKSRSLLPSRFACHLPPGGRLSVNSIITQISVKNNREKILCPFVLFLKLYLRINSEVVRGEFAVDEGIDDGLG